MRNCLFLLGVLVTLTTATYTSHGSNSHQEHKQRDVREIKYEAMKLFEPGDINVLEGIAMLFGASKGDVDSIISLVKLGLGAIDLVDRIVEKVFNGSSISIDLSLPGHKDREILAMFEVLTYRFEEMQIGIQGIESSLRDMAQHMPNIIRWEVMLDSLEQYTKPINSLHHRFSYYQTHRDMVENHTLRDFAESVISHDTDSIMSLMASIHSMVAPDAPPMPTVLQTAQLSRTGDEYELINLRVNQDYSIRYKQKTSQHDLAQPEEDEIGELSLRPSIFSVLENVVKSYDRCSMRQTPQQMAMGMYSLVALTQARGFAMTNFAYLLLRVYGLGNFSVEQDLSRSLYEYYSKSAMTEAVKIISRASNEYWRCDPPKQIMGDTYVMFTELLQLHIENEADMNDRSTCLKQCNTYTHTRTYGCYSPHNQPCGKRKRCKGTLHNCKFINADADVCYSSSPYRRYDWIKYENGRTLGERGTCNDLQKVDSWWRWFVHCSNCICLCDDPVSPTTDRYVSLIPTETNLDDSMVITGIKFSKHKRVVTLEIQQGRTLPQGLIDPSSLEWISMQDIDVDNPFYKAGTDYQILSYEARSLDLDILEAPTGHVITGTRFRMLGTHLNLEVKVTPISFTTGLLNPGLSYWLSKDKSPLSKESPRIQMQLFRPNDPSKVTATNDVYSEENMYVEFQQSDLDADASQSTVPFFDALPVTTAPPSWLVGLNLHHKGNKLSGGFLSFTIQAYNVTRHFEQPQVPDSESQLD